MKKNVATMKSCEDCLHYEACVPYAEDIGADANWKTRWANECEKFKDRTEYMRGVRCGLCEYRRLGGKAPFMYYYCANERGLRADVGYDDHCPYGKKR